MIYGCIGEKLSHSYSKEIHSKIGDYEYEIHEVAREDLRPRRHLYTVKQNDNRS